jgi:hypothetical protein
MTAPTGTRTRSIPLTEGGQVMVYSTPDQLVLQLRLEIPTETDILRPSFKVALAITTEESLLIAGEFLQAASTQIRQEKKIRNAV